MKQVIDYVMQYEREYSQLPLFKRFDGEPGTLDDLRAFAPTILFFTHCAKDYQRLNADRFDDPELRRIAQIQYREEKNHADWLRADMKSLGLPARIEEAHSDEHDIERDSAYVFMNEALSAKHDSSRLASMWVFETTGETLFSRTIKYFPRSGFTGKLVYYGATHLDVEHDHIIFKEHERRYIDNVQLTPQVRAEAMACAKRCYEAMTGMMNYCETAIVRARTAREREGQVSAASARR
jgi:hypothetical protein